MVESDKERHRTNRNVTAMFDDSACWEPTHAQTHAELCNMRAVYLGVRRSEASADDGTVLHQWLHDVSWHASSVLRASGVGAGGYG